MQRFLLYFEEGGRGGYNENIIHYIHNVQRTRFATKSNTHRLYFAREGTRDTASAQMNVQHSIYTRARMLVHKWMCSILYMQEQE